MCSDQSAPPSAVSPAAELIRGLCDKYQALLALRVTREEVSPRAALAALAAAYPGALRELDRLPLQLIERRLASLRAVASGATGVERWMTLQIAYHGFMRAVLRLRRALLASNERSFADPGRCLQRLAYVAAADEPAPERLDAATLQMIVRPPRGRLNPWVIERVARDHAVQSSDIERALFVDG